MTHAIFIKSYAKDFKWLKYCLLSIRKYCTGFDDVVIVVPPTDVEECKTFATQERVVGYGEYGEGYLFQQMIKVNAHNFTKCDFIHYVDSDCIFRTPTTPLDYFDGDKPWMYKTRYGNLEGAEVWKEVTSSAIGFPVEWEYMRRHGLVYHRRTLMKIQELYPKINDYIMSRPARHFSEFNFMGAFAEFYEPNDYIWKDTATNEFIPERLKQFWSYSGCTKEEQEEMEKLIG